MFWDIWPNCYPLPWKLMIKDGWLRTVNHSVTMVGPCRFQLWKPVFGLTAERTWVLHHKPPQAQATLVQGERTWTLDTWHSLKLVMGFGSFNITFRSPMRYLQIAQLMFLGCGSGLTPQDTCQQRPSLDSISDLRLTLRPEVLFWRGSFLGIMKSVPLVPVGHPGTCL